MLSARRRDYLVPLSIAVLAILVRVAAQFALGFYREPDTWEEGTIALSLASGHGYVYHDLGTTMQAFRAPAYAFLLAAAYIAFGSSVVVAGVLQALLGAVLVVTIYSIGQRVMSRSVGLLSAFLVATHPGLVVYAAKIHQLNLDVVLVAVAVLLGLAAHRRRRGDAALGTIGGLILLSRPTLLLVVFLSALWRAAQERMRRRAIAGACVTVLLVTAFGGIWIGRNYAVIGEPTLTSTTGLTLWIGHNPAATGGTLAKNGIPVLDAVPAMRNLVWGRNEVEQDHIFTNAALAYVREDPLREARAIASRFVLFWSFGSETGHLYPANWLAIYQVYYWSFLGLAIVGTIVATRRGRAARTALIVLSMLSFAAAQSLFYIDGRHRWAVEPLLLVLSAIGIFRALAPVAHALQGRQGVRFESST